MKEALLDAFYAVFRISPIVTVIILQAGACAIVSRSGNGKNLAYLCARLDAAFIGVQTCKKVGTFISNRMT
jgi:hypothetical protein